MLPSVHIKDKTETPCEFVKQKMEEITQEDLEVVWKIPWPSYTSVDTSRKHTEEHEESGQLLHLHWLWKNTLRICISSTITQFTSSLSFLSYQGDLRWRQSEMVTLWEPPKLLLCLQTGDQEYLRWRLVEKKAGKSPKSYTGITLQVLTAEQTWKPREPVCSSGR